MPEFQKDLYLIWSYEREAWWRPNERGYTWDVVQAGLYEKPMAEAICRNSRGNEAMLPARPVLSAFAADARRLKDEQLSRHNILRLDADDPLRRMERAEVREAFYG